jgi:hypothetical protein
MPSVATDLLNRIVDFYLKSHDFNGIPAKDLLRTPEETAAIATLKHLVVAGRVDVYSGEYDNPHIKRFPSLGPAMQLSFLESNEKAALCCIYPSVKTMRRLLPSIKYRTKPFTRFLALGHAQLEPVFFQLGVIGRYQSDPRYLFRFDGLDGHISVKVSVDSSRAMGEADRVFLQTFGLGKSATGYRVIVSFPRYLSNLSARHQQHWQSYKISGKCKMEKNYALRGLHGQWTDGESIYDALLQEMSHINQMCHRIGIPDLFRRDYSRDGRDAEGSDLALDEPKGFGLLMVPTKKHFLEFAQVLDKIISENLNTRFFASQGIELEEKMVKDGQVVVSQKGTLRLLEEWIAKYIRMEGDKGPAFVVAPLKEVRKLRQGPAHKLIDDDFSIKYQHQKEQLIVDVYRAISNIRMFFQTHPKTKDYVFPEGLKPENLVVF